MTDAVSLWKMFADALTILGSTRRTGCAYPRSGNNTEEVIDLSAQRVVHTITGVSAPQGVVYSPETNKLFVASTNGKLYIYDGTTFDLVATFDFHGDADNLRYDPAEKRVYVGYGDDEAAAIGMVDATTNKRPDEGFKRGRTQSPSKRNCQARIFM